MFSLITLHYCDHFLLKVISSAKLSYDKCICRMKPVHNLEISVFPLCCLSLISLLADFQKNLTRRLTLLLILRKIPILQTC